MTTAAEATKDILRGFRIKDSDLTQTPFYRPNLSMHITPVDASKRLDLL